MSKRKDVDYIPDVIIDLVGMMPKQATAKLNNLKRNYSIGTKMRIIVGKAVYSNSPPVLPTLARKMLNEQNISWSYAKAKDGGDGAIECTIE